MKRADRLRFEAIARESQRRLAWLKFIASRCRGLAPDLVRQALYGKSTAWPPTSVDGRAVTDEESKDHDPIP